MSSSRVLAATGVALLLAACEEPSTRRPPSPYGYGPQPYGPQPYGPQPYGPQPYGPQPYGPQPAPTALPTTAPAPAPAPANDPIDARDLAYLRKRAGDVLNDLVAALPSGPASRVAGIPLVVDSRPGEVNAFASCQGGKASMAITDGLLQIESHLAQSRAVDELYGTSKTDEYIALVARGQQPGAPVVAPPPGFFSDAQWADGRRVARQHQLLDEQIGFVMGHELGHHYLGHLPCVAGGPLSAGELGQVLSSAVPVFNQPNEIAADVAGTNNVLAAGSRRSDYRWTENGGLLTMRFFAGLDQMSPVDVLFTFESTHPPPQLRTPIIQQAANTWRFTGGNVPWAW